MYEDWKGPVSLKVLRDGKTVSEQIGECKVPALGREIVAMKTSMPTEPGNYTIVAQIQDEAGKPVRSLRDVKVER